MEIIFGYHSSLAFWRLKRPQARTLELLASRKMPVCLRPGAREQPCKPDASCVERAARMGIKPQARPVDFLVPNSRLRVRSAAIATSVLSSSIPQSAFVQVDGGMFVASPELCLLLGARVLAEPNLIEIGYEFCGRYRSSNTPGGSMLSQQPKLTSVARLRSLVNRAHGADGLGAVRKALPHILENSESPKETHLSMLSCLPSRMGGYGFLQPTLNFPITIFEHARGRGVGHTCRCDLYWPEAKLDVEYDSLLHHSDAKKQMEDSARRTALAHEDILVITVSRNQLHSLTEMDKVAQAMARRMGRRLRPQAADWKIRQIRLRTALFGRPSART